MRAWPFVSVVLSCGLFAASLNIATGGEPSGPLHAEPADWPTFQHRASRNAVVDRPTIAKPAIAWSARVGICGYLNGAVVAGDRVFVSSSGSVHNKPDKLDGVHALALDSGRTLWHAPTAGDACGLSVAGDRVYVTSDDGFVRCLDANDGRTVWSRQFDHELYAPPLVLGDRVIVDDGAGGIVAIDTESGGTLWHTQTHGDVIRGALTTDGKRLFAAFRNGRVYAMLVKDGAMTWSAMPISRNFQVYGAPTLAGPFLLLPYVRDTQYPTPALCALDPRTGRALWHHGDDRSEPGAAAFANLRTSPAVWGIWALAAEPYSNELRFYAAADGRHDFSIPLGSAMFQQWASPVVVGDLAYVPRHDGSLYAVDLKQRRMKWRYYLGDHAKVGPNPPRDLMPDDSPDIAWNPAIGKPLYATPAIARDGSIVIGTGDGWVYRIVGAR